MGASRLRRSMSIAAIAVVVAIPAAARSGPATLDPSWGQAGVAKTTVTRGVPQIIHADVSGVAPVPGAVWVVGSASAPGPLHWTSKLPSDSIIIARYLPNGKLDAHFAAGGLLRGTHAPFDEALEVTWLYELAFPDGGLLLRSSVYRNHELVENLVRMRRDGTVDRTFGASGVARVHDGKCSRTPRDLVRSGAGLLYGLGKVCGAGENANWFAATRLLANGRLDRAFGNGGTAALQIGRRTPENDFASDRQVMATPDGGVLVAGTADTLAADGRRSAPTVVRFTAAGKVDRAFGSSGIAQPAGGFEEAAFGGALVQTDGRIVLGGCEVFGPRLSADSFDLFRLDADGTPDTTWGDGGVVRIGGVCGSIHAAPDGKIVVVGNRISRLEADGTLDRTFGRDGLDDLPPGLGGHASRAIAVQPDGKLLYAMRLRTTPQRRAFAVYRYRD